MNILADIHSKLYEPGISEEEYQKRRKDFLELYYRLRYKNENSISAENCKNRRRYF